MRIFAKALTVVFGSLLIASTASAELFSVSLGIPVSHTFSEEGLESDGTSGVFAAVKLPILVGLGVENYSTDIKGQSQDVKLNTTMYDVFYLLPIPIINFTLGVGLGNTEFDCSNCPSTYDTGTATQWYGSLGFPFLGIADLHVSYRSVSSKIKDNSGAETDVSGTVTGIGVSVGF